MSNVRSDVVPAVVGRELAGRYRLVADLSGSEPGRVFRAWDRERHGYVVIRFIGSQAKVWPPRHLSVVPVIADGIDAGRPFVVMPYLGGGNLAQRTSFTAGGEAEPQPPAAVWHWLPAIADALDAAHADGVVHGDVKPTNVLFDGPGLAYLSDFEEGVSTMKAGSERPPAVGRLTVGTPDYLAPECYQAPARTPATDQYALAVTVYEMLAGRRPFADLTPSALADAHTTRLPDALAAINPAVPDAVSVAVARGLAKSPRERFGSCVEFARAVLTPLARPTSTERLRLACPKCGRLLNLDPESAGQSGACPRCRRRVIVAADLQSLIDPADRDTGMPSAAGNRPGRSRRNGKSSNRMTALLFCGVIALILTRAGSRGSAKNEPRENEPPAADTIADPLPGAAPPAPPVAEQRPRPVDPAPVPKPDPKPPRDPAPAEVAARPPVEKVEPPEPAAAPPPMAPPPPVAMNRPVMRPGNDAQPRKPAPAVVPPAPEPAAPPPARQPPPAPDVVERALEGVRDTLRTAYDTAARDGHSLLLTEELMAKGKVSKDPLQRFALLTEAERLSLRDQRLEAAIDCIRERAKSFEFDTVAAEREAVRTVAAGDRIRNPRVAHEALFVAEKSLRDGHVSLAGDAVDLARRVAAHVESPEVARELEAEVEAIATRLRERLDAGQQ